VRVLITGFDPFGGEKMNPSFEAVKQVRIQNQEIEIIKLEVPTVFYKAMKTIEEEIEKSRPDIVICTGQAGGRTDITIERIGINVIDARIPDNEGQQPIDEKIDANGEDGYFSNLPVKAMVRSLKNNDIPASVSNTAGTFVCNYLLYGVMHLVKTKYPEMRAGFIHVPFLPEQVTDKKNMPSMSMEMMSKAFEIAIETAATTEVDVKEIGGTLH
jgi:pyroglutamyl-peptidase